MAHATGPVRCVGWEPRRRMSAAIPTSSIITKEGLEAAAVPIVVAVAEEDIAEATAARATAEVGEDPSAQGSYQDGPKESMPNRTA